MPTPGGALRSVCGVGAWGSSMTWEPAAPRRGTSPGNGGAGWRFPRPPSRAGPGQRPGEEGRMGARAGGHVQQCSETPMALLREPLPPPCRTTGQLSCTGTGSGEALVKAVSRSVVLLPSRHVQSPREMLPPPLWSLPEAGQGSRANKAQEPPPTHYKQHATQAKTNLRHRAICSCRQTA